ncbi:MAG: hypothetical protein OXE87_06730 [Chloroflexi bacterium]|nr:hypothetical protein [Chloroflexota bacterium]
MNETYRSIMWLLFGVLALVVLAVGFAVAGQVPKDDEPWKPWATEFGFAAVATLVVIVAVAFVLTSFWKRWK